MMIGPLIGCYGTGPLFSKMKVSSVFEYLEIRFESKAVRLVGTVIYVWKNFIASAIFMYLKIKRQILGETVKNIYFLPNEFTAIKYTVLL